MPADFTTRVYKYGAVPLGPFPEEGVEELWRANRLWNALVEIHNENSLIYDESRRKADPEYADLSRELGELEERIVAAYGDKRTARMKAQTRSSEHPLIAAENEKIAAHKEQRKELWERIKKPRQRADKLIDKTALNALFNGQVKEAQQQKATGGLKGATANEIYRNFKEARSRVFKTPRAKLRFHRIGSTSH